MFSSTMIVIYKGRDNLCVFFFQIYFFLQFFILQVSEPTKKNCFCNLNLVGPYCMCTEQTKMYQYFNLSRLWIELFQRQVYSGGHFEHLLN